MLQLTKQSSESELKQYFASVLELTKSDNKYPINLDDVWPLVYSLKNKAVRALKENFFENEDFITVTQNGQGGKFDRTDYYLTTSCLEYFIARKVRTVFEVYRQVFHKAVQQPSLPTTYKDALKQLLLQVEANEHLQIENEKQRMQIEKKDELITQKDEQVCQLTDKVIEMGKKVSYLDQILANKSTILTTSIAQDYGMSAKAFNRLLNRYGIQHKVDKQWILYAPYLTEGYVHSKQIEITHADGSKKIHLNTEWTQKGRLFLYQKLKSKGVVPMIER